MVLNYQERRMQGFCAKRVLQRQREESTAAMESVLRGQKNCSVMLKVMLS